MDIKEKEKGMAEAQEILDWGIMYAGPIYEN